MTEGAVMTNRRIVIGYDRTIEAKNAAGWALDQAARTGAPVEFLYAYEWPIWAPSTTMVPSAAVWPDSATVESIRDMMEEAVASARRTHPAVRTTYATVDGNAALTLIDRSADAGLVVVGSLGHSAVAGLLGSVSASVSAHAHCPVVVVRDREPTAAPVVAGYDAHESVLAFAAEQASVWHVPLRVIHAWKPLTVRYDGKAIGVRTITPAERRPFDEALDVWREKYPGLPIVADAVVDQPAAALAAASTSAQLLVVGSRGHGAARGTLLGSVSQHLLRHSACSIAVVH
jgi:nucleotide-binding universal stress UspA family protein